MNTAFYLVGGIALALILFGIVTPYRQSRQRKLLEAARKRRIDAAFLASHPKYQADSRFMREHAATTFRREP